MEDCKAKVLLTASGVMRGPKKIELKKIADKWVDCINMWSTFAELRQQSSAPRCAATFALSMYDNIVLPELCCPAY